MNDDGNWTMQNKGEEKEKQQEQEQQTAWNIGYGERKRLDNNCRNPKVPNKHPSPPFSAQARQHDALQWFRIGTISCSWFRQSRRGVCPSIGLRVALMEPPPAALRPWLLVAMDVRALLLNGWRKPLLLPHDKLLLCARNFALSASSRIIFFSRRS